MCAFSAGVILDWIIGDPYNIPHPIRWIGSAISRLETHFLGKKTVGTAKAEVSEKQTDPRKNKREYRQGLFTVLVVLLGTGLLTGLLLWAAYGIHFVLGILVESILTCYTLAAKSLRVESMKVHSALTEGDLDKARYAVSMIVGRDTQQLDAQGITRAAVETVAENTSDGVIAPLLYNFLGGPVLGMLYKAVNTMDSMIGYRNDRYEYFGKCGAKLDDLVNFLPARIGAGCMILAAFLDKECDGPGAFAIFKRDRFQSKSPNSAQTESVCAGALGVRLLGPAYYFGVYHEKPFIGEAVREIRISDIPRANRLMYLTEILLWIFCELLFLGILAGTFYRM